MTDAFLESYSSHISLTVFLTVLILMGTWETLAPQKIRRVSRHKRWLNNLSLVFFNTAVVRLLFPGSLIALTLLSQSKGWGVLNNLEWPYPLKVMAAFVFFDFIIYVQHVVFHAVPMLWRLHQVHHADLDLDVTSGARFHTIEILISMVIKSAVVILIGPPLLAVVLFEVVLNAAAMFNHSNVRIPAKIDKLLRWFIVTPDMHRIHHSTLVNETNTNFGFNLSWWDRLLGTYLENPKLGQEKMNIGLNYIQNEEEATLFFNLLRIPFYRKSTEYTVIGK